MAWSLNTLTGLRGDRMVLCYHAVSPDWPADLSLPAEELDDQVRRLQRRGYVGTTLTESLSATRAHKKTFVVSFDDGYRSVLERAAPVLRERGVPGTLFVPVDQIATGRPMSWPGIDRWLGGPHESELLSLDWDEVRQLRAEGWEIGSHTCTHPHLTQLDDERLRDELERSRRRLGDELSEPCRSIAYPYGDVDARVADAARDAGYESGATLPARWHGWDSPLETPRLGIYHGQSTRVFAMKTSRLVRAARRLIGR